MSIWNETNHQDVAEALPDYAIGAMPERELQRVSEHLQRCKPCRVEFYRLLETISALPLVAGPSAATKERLFQRAGIGNPASTLQRSYAPPVRIEQARWSRRVLRVSWLVAAAALIVALAVGIWSLQLREDLQQAQSITELISQPASARELTDKEVVSDASATLYVDGTSDQALLVAANLPQLEAGQAYDIFLFTQSGERVDAGTFNADASGNARIVVEAPEVFSEYWAIGVSAEVVDDDGASEAPLIVGGWLK